MNSQTETQICNWLSLHEHLGLVLGEDTINEQLGLVLVKDTINEQLGLVLVEVTINEQLGLVLVEDTINGQFRSSNLKSGDYANVLILPRQAGPGLPDGMFKHHFIWCSFLTLLADIVNVKFQPKKMLTLIFWSFYQ